MSTPSVARSGALDAAVSTYLARQARLAHPSGTFDGGGRWFPSDEEQRDCCKAIRSPSRRWPYSLVKHCRSVAHVAALCHGEARTLRRAARPALAESAAIRASAAPEALIAEPGWTGDTPITPEEILRAAGIDDARQAAYQRRMSALLAGRTA